MAYHPQGTKGTTLRRIAGVGHLILSAIRAGQIFFTFFFSLAAYPQLTEKVYGILNMAKYNFAEFGLKNVLNLIYLFMALSIVYSLVLAVQLFTKSKKDEGQIFFTVTGALGLIVAVITLILSRNMGLIFPIIVFILTIIGGLSGRKPKPVSRPSYPQQDPYNPYNHPPYYL